MAGALTSPNGMTLNSYRPSWVTNAVFSFVAGSIGICQYPDAKSNAVKYLAPSSDSRVSSIRGNGYIFLAVISFT